ncbi:dynactin subunit p27 [Heterostelium album PN500]|uniref:Dynactin subunit 6 n=1 Tax=Heterostelium pallidum (strain ATCC 26659 / Pp 5 / PN500) TaxID=670386 RepID=D3BGQ6_HETP5|nr:dynactin subunit p27 [Heterostelium album PN500]EFA79290.1 dynactin subunit p27 [Heterostelium album PN500]|eukprot:XP_020431411.1 dynactin subunit p27 [Heterostelium album PN500]
MTTVAATSTPISLDLTIICQDCVVGEHVTIGKGTVLHPKASITSLHGAPITIGENNIIEELVSIVNRSKEPMIIGAGNLFEVGSVIECKSIGNENIVEAKAKVSCGVTINNGCTIGAGCITPENEHYLDNSIVSGPTLHRINSTIPLEMHSATHIKHLEFLHKTLPNFHNMKK